MNFETQFMLFNAHSMEGRVIEGQKVSSGELKGKYLCILKINPFFTSNLRK